MLRKRHPLATIDGVIQFDVDSHTYTVDGVTVPRSVTAVVDELFPKFKPRKTINLYYEKWKTSGKSKYQSVIAASATDADAKRAIAASWAADTTARARARACESACV